MAAVISVNLLKNSRHNGYMTIRPCVSSASYSSTSKSKSPGPAKPVAEPKPNSYFDPSLPGLKRGTGGRSSFNGVVATVFGSTGFIGKTIVNRLGKTGSQIIIPYRCDDYDIRPLKLCGDLGQVLFQPFDLRDEESIRKSMKYSNVVINMIGRDWETKNFKFEDVNVTGARTLARLAREAGVKRFIHFSSLNSSPNPTPLMLPEGSKFLKTKYEGEVAVRDEFPDATIFRPADMFGQGDRFLRYYAQWWRRNVYTMPLYKKGEKTIKQPVFMSDVATGVMNALKDPETAGKAFDIVGPKRYLLSDLMDYIMRVVRRDAQWGYKRTDLMWSPLFRARISLTEKISPGFPIGCLGWDKIERDHVTDLLTGNPTLEDLGVSLTDLESRAEWELKCYRRGLYYDEELGEFPPPEPPITTTLKEVPV